MVTIPMFAASFLSVALTLCMVWVVVSDICLYIIPNRLNALIAVLFLLAAFTLPVAPLSALGAALIMFLVGLGLYSLGLMGGGDIKLLTVLTLWTGWSIASLQFIFLTAIFGGLLVLVVLPLRVVAPTVWRTLRPTKPLPRFLTKKQAVPYGIAIASAFTFLLWTDGIAGFAMN